MNRDDTVPRYHVEGQTSTVGPRWAIWDGLEHKQAYRGLADESSALALCDKLNWFHEQSVALAKRPPEPVDAGLVEAEIGRAIIKAVAEHYSIIIEPMGDGLGWASTETDTEDRVWYPLPAFTKDSSHD